MSPTQERIDQRKTEDIEFMKTEPIGQPICLKSQKEGKDGFPIKFGIATKIGSNQFELCEGSRWEPESLKFIKNATAEDIIEEWWVD